MNKSCEEKFEQELSFVKSCEQKLYKYCEHELWTKVVNKIWVVNDECWTQVFGKSWVVNMNTNKNKLWIMKIMNKTCKQKLGEKVVKMSCEQKLSTRVELWTVSSEQQLWTRVEFWTPVVNKSCEHAQILALHWLEHDTWEDHKCSHLQLHKSMNFSGDRLWQLNQSICGYILGPTWFYPKPYL